MRQTVQSGRVCEELRREKQLREGAPRVFVRFHLRGYG